MAWFRYKCEKDGEFKLSLDERKKTAPCPKCQVESGQVIRLGSITIVERLDNGAMARAVERLDNIEEIMEKRSEAHDDKMAGDDGDNE